MYYFKIPSIVEEAEIREVNFNTTHLVNGKMETQPQFF